MIRFFTESTIHNLKSWLGQISRSRSILNMKSRCTSLVFYLLTIVLFVAAKEKGSGSLFEEAMLTSAPLPDVKKTTIRSRRSIPRSSFSNREGHLEAL
ncbi:unnamed protein product [Protopolystoma xenopodis]|uniref:Uncharacterized protein n=1 Tax=Protopolystoma xenopodis TaxID=117903 RepID=A0A3S5A665_9PLAT|nr:unnamed protein product [Protopolystoma xenopodis]